MTTPIDELDGPELDERLARAMGPFNHPEMWWWKETMPEWPDSVPALYAGPAYHASLDALLRDVWPVCKERGASDWRLNSWGDAAIWPQSDPSNGVYKTAPIYALALARAMLTVLEAGE